MIHIHHKNGALQICQASVHRAEETRFLFPAQDGTRIWADWLSCWNWDQMSGKWHKLGVCTDGANSWWGSAHNFGMSCDHNRFALETVLSAPPEFQYFAYSLFITDYRLPRSYWHAMHKETHLEHKFRNPKYSDISSDIQSINSDTQGISSSTQITPV